MPNWCNNDIVITGPKNKIADLWTEATVKEGLLEAMAPIGEWDYGTACETWGTKWDISLEGLEFIDNEDGTASIVGYADSAWAPPVDALRRFCENNQDVSAEIRYFEPGMSFVGKWTNEDGEEHYDDVADLLETTVDEDPLLVELMEHFDVYGWYDFGDEEEEMVIDDEA